MLTFPNTHYTIHLFTQKLSAFTLEALREGGFEQVSKKCMGKERWRLLGGIHRGNKTSEMIQKCWSSMIQERNTNMPCCVNNVYSLG